MICAVILVIILLYTHMHTYTYMQTGLLTETEKELTKTNSALQKSTIKEFDFRYFSWLFILKANYSRNHISLNLSFHFSKSL